MVNQRLHTTASAAEVGCRIAGGGGGDSSESRKLGCAMQAERQADV